MPRKTKAVRLTGAQIDALLTMGEPHITAALKRLRLRTTDADTEQVGSAIVDLLTADRESVESALLAARVPDLEQALLNKTAGVQADDGEA